MSPSSPAPEFADQELPLAAHNAVAALQAAGFLTEWTDAKAERGADPWPADEEACLLAVLERYYLGYDGSTQSLRVTEDRFFYHRDGAGVSAPSVVRRLIVLSPELEGTQLDCIGDDLLVVRCGDQHVAVVDEEPGRGVSVRALVHAINGLLASRGQPLRFIPVASDDSREAYLAATASVAHNLFTCGLLDVDDEEELRDFTRTTE